MLAVFLVEEYKNVLKKLCCPDPGVSVSKMHQRKVNDFFHFFDTLWFCLCIFLFSSICMSFSHSEKQRWLLIFSEDCFAWPFQVRKFISVYISSRYLAEWFCLDWLEKPIFLLCCELLWSSLCCVCPVLCVLTLWGLVFYCCYLFHSSLLELLPILLPLNAHLDKIIINLGTRNHSFL